MSYTRAIERLVAGPYLEFFARSDVLAGPLGQRTRQVRTRIRRPRRLRQIARGRLSRHSRARCCRRPKVGAEMTRRKQPEAQLQRAGAQIETADNIDAALAFLCRLGVLR